MRAIQIDRFGTPDVLGLVEAPQPEPGPGDVLIRTVATSINPVDDKTREGAIGEGTPPLPMTLGWSGSRRGRILPGTPGSFLNLRAALEAVPQISMSEAAREGG